MEEQESIWWFHIDGDKESMKFDARFPKLWLLVLVAAVLIEWAPSLWNAIQTAVALVQ